VFTLISKKENYSKDCIPQRTICTDLRAIRLYTNEHINAAAGNRVTDGCY